jgi:hypothetical protein
MSRQDAEKCGMSKPERCPVIQEMVIRGNRTKTNERYRLDVVQREAWLTMGLDEDGSEIAQ